jgi:hypothetical protein
MWVMLGQICGRGVFSSDLPNFPAKILPDDIHRANQFNAHQYHHLLTCPDGDNQCCFGVVILWEYRGSNMCVLYGSLCTTYFMYTLEKVESNHVMFQSVCLDWFCWQQSKLCLICMLKSKLDKIII